MAHNRRNVYYVISTHWDREWWQTAQNFRYQLVQLLDRVFDAIADGTMRGPFQSDGQAIMIEDYLEVRPERRTQVEQFAREGKLSVGPWFVLPDEFCIGGESIIRNLELGHRLANAFGGKPCHAGFLNDQFGHISQMPQILAGFGIPMALIWRGTGNYDTRLLKWQGADGTVLPCHRFWGYDTCGGYTRIAFGRTEPPTPEDIQRRIDEYLERERKVTPAGPILMFDGADHLEWDPFFYQQFIQRLEGDDPNYTFHHVDLDRFADAVVAEADRIDTLLEGELRQPGKAPFQLEKQWVIPGVLSSRVWIKQRNAACEALLTQWAEPLGAMAQSLIGMPYPQGFLDVAWKWLLTNHPHDSICGCSIDQVHRDMVYRFDQCEQIGERLQRETGLNLAASIEGELNDQQLRVTVFNPLPTELDGVVDLTLQIPDNWPCFQEFFGYEQKPAFRIHDAGGSEISCQRTSQAMDQRRRRIRWTQPAHDYRTNDIGVSLALRIPALGYTTLTVTPTSKDEPTRCPAKLPHMASPTGPRSMGNEHLEVIAQANGTLTLTDKQTGRTYRDLLLFEDCADIGDGWYHCPPVNDQLFTSAASHAEVAFTSAGPLRTTMRIRTTLRVPEAFDFASMTRADRLTDLAIDSHVTLRAGADHLEVETIVHNTACDHRLRVLATSGAGNASTFFTDTAFDVIEREIALPDDNHTYRELDVETRPMRSWAAVTDGERGLAIASTGLLEVTVRDLPERPLALTLMRCTRRTVATGGEPDGQLLGESRFHYAILPVRERIDRMRLFHLGQHLAAGLHVVQIRPEDQALRRAAHPLPAEHSHLEIEGDLVLAAFRQQGGTAQLRLFNPMPERVTGALVLGDANITTCQPVNLKSEPLGEPLPVADRRVVLDVPPKKILTLQLR